jgi:hypothetical protein
MYRATNVPLRYLIAAAYRMPVARVLGGPEWVGAASIDLRFVGGDRFDIAAKLPDGAPAPQVPSMLRTLLADRFKLIVHTEARDAPIYALVLARNDGKLGSRLRKAAVDCEARGTALATPDTSAATAPSTQDEPGRCKLEVGGEILGRGQRLGTLVKPPSKADTISTFNSPSSRRRQMRSRHAPSEAAASSRLFGNNSASSSRQVAASRTSSSLMASRVLRRTDPTAPPS